MKANKICGLMVALSVAVVSARADSLELKNGSLIKGKFMGGKQTSISFQVGSSLQSYDVADIRSLRFESDAQSTSPSVPPNKPNTASTIEPDEIAKSAPAVTILPVRVFRFVLSMRLTPPKIEWDIVFRLLSRNHYS